MHREQGVYQELQTANEEDYWQAVLAKDASFEGTFFYAVRSTGVYCRPSCPARRPRREQVLFFSLPEAAQKAGFRPCQRCTPQSATTRNPQAELVQQVCHYIEANLERSLTLATLGEAVSMSPHHLQRVFKQIMGISPRQYTEVRRLSCLKTQLKQGQAVTTALYETGYGSSSRLYEQASTRLGMTPATYCRGGKGMHISYTLVDCPLGRLLIAITDRGLCAVSLGDSDAELVAELLGEYPAAEFYRNDVDLSLWVSSILDHLKGEPIHLDLPLDLQATAFQWRVWQELRAIPYGSTRSYSEIAKALGNPKAARAVARACATNPVSIVIPCHRVVREDGSLCGYRWGVERKQALIAKEEQSVAQPKDDFNSLSNHNNHI
ncbi:MAG TPA: bifunctional DNA-binding transcriptional regulator/O6-methylguanine-DNA methyltransferase Ada [Coleofasciculaceae cyanobacterium]